MDFKRKELMLEGFQGFITISELQGGRKNEIPNSSGVYIVLREADSTPIFLPKNPGGHFKKKNPTVQQRKLISKWVKDAHTIYIGVSENIRRRIQQLLDFGNGKPVGHWGGRFIWQIENSSQFVIAWRSLKDSDSARNLKVSLLKRFKDIYGSLPFANLRF